ncbi:MAG: FHA domain-containing protein [Planctomycetota bacterium]|nr:MAG: FHA domain-containing protein [Planctomycetota bacterium]
MDSLGERCYGPRVSLRLVVVSGPCIGSQLRLGQHTVLEIGRSPAAALTLADPQVADLHLKLYREGDGFTCFDLTGAGFLHNRQRTLKARLAVGDVIEVGAHAIRLISDLPEMVPRLDRAAIPPAASAAPAGGAALRALQGNDAGRVFPLDDRAVTIIGRGATTDVTLWDIRASRAHARIDRQGSAYRLSDLNSSNGTFVNGRRITTHHLRPGDTIRIGTSLLEFVRSG